MAIDTIITKEYLHDGRYHHKTTNYFYDMYIYMYVYRHAQNKTGMMLDIIITNNTLMMLAIIIKIVRL